MRARRVEPRGVESFLTFGAVSEPLTAIKGVYALGAGQMATIKDSEINLRTYWKLPPAGTVAVNDAAAGASCATGRRGEESPRGGRAARGVPVRGPRLFDSRRARLGRGFECHDVLGGFCRVELLGSPLHRPHAGATHRHPRASGVELDDLTGLRTEAFTAMDQPSADGINTYIVSRAAASRGLKVALSGLGADELFDGYRHAQRVKKMERIRPFARPVAGLLRRMPEAVQPGEKLRAWLHGEG